MLKMLFLFCALIVGVLVLSPSVKAQFDPLEQACQGTQATSPACQQAASQGTNDPLSGQDGVLRKAANLLALFAGSAAVIWTVMGGLAFLTSGGDSQKISEAKSKIMGGVIGMIIVAATWLIVGFVSKIILQT